MFFLSLSDQMQVAIILAVLFGLLVWGRWRYDGIVLITLAFMVMMDLVPAKEAFMGFGHPAVITVALVLLISKGLEKSGFISMIGNFLHKKVASQAQFMVLILVTAAFLSSFMNNIGAMAMLLPITIGIAQKKEWNPSKFLMPLAFASILGGMNTKIGTPPNIIISEIRDDVVGADAFGFFDFAYAGLPITFLGILFITVVGWRLVNQREPNGLQRPLVDIQEYLVEMTINEDSPLVGQRIHKLTASLGSDTVLMGVVSDKGRIRKPHNFETFDALQILVLKISPDDAANLQTEFGLSIDPDFNHDIKEGELGEIEAMITPRSRLIGRKFNYFMRLSGGDIFLLGLWRQGSKFRRRLARELFKSGDVLLLSTRSSDERAAEKTRIIRPHSALAKRIGCY